MQRIERYGVIALVLFLVTIVAVSFWDDGAAMAGGKGPKEQDRVAGRKNQRPANRGAQTGKTSSQGRALPATSGTLQARKEASRAQPPRAGAQGQKSGPRKKQNLKFETVPGTVADPIASRQATQPGSKRGATAPREETVKFPDLLTAPNPAKQARPERPATNYDTIQQRSQALAAQEARRQREAAAREGEGRTQPKAQQNRPTRGAGTYRVQPGDTLSEISFKTLGTSKRWREIQALNGNLDPSQLAVDMVLKLPQGAAHAVPASFKKTTEEPTVVGGPGTYVVRKGDVLSQIAQDHLGGASRWREIAKLNPSVDPNRLMEGAVLRMPGGASPALASLTTTPQPTRKKNRVR